MKPDAFTMPGKSNLSEKELESNIATTWISLTERWDTIEREFGGLDIYTLRQRWIRPLMFHLDFNLDFQRADIILEGALHFPVIHLGRVGTEAVTLPVHSVLYQADYSLSLQ